VIGVGWTFILSVVAYIISKGMSVPTFYPIFMLLGITRLSIPKKILIKSSVIMSLFYILIVISSGIFFQDYECLIGFSLLFFEILYFYNHRDEEVYLKIIGRFFLILSLMFWIFISISIIHREQFHFAQLTGIFELSHWNRSSVDLRNFMIRSLVPWSGDHWLGSVFRSLFELIGIWISIFAYRKIRAGQKIWMISFVLAFSYSFIASSRGAIVTICLIMAVNLFDRYPKIKRYFQFVVIPSSLIVFSFTSKFLNGRDILYRNAFENLSWNGHGIGASGVLAKSLTNGANTYVHNIHLEMMYDWGIALYVLILTPFIIWIFKNGYLRTTIFIFVTCSLSYTIYSPWLAWTLYFAWKEDRSTVLHLSKQS
jgi:hypothetical protein